MYNEQLEKLIEMALMDGELTDKERTILSKKAESFGVDIDEFEMVLEARLFEKKQADHKPTKEKKPESNKFGDMKKCPACGSPVQLSVIKCFDCDHEFSGVEANSSISTLFEMLNDAEDMRKDDRGTSDNPLSAIGGLMSDAFSDMRGPGKVDKKKMAIISNFPIPTTKDDILEFLSLALPKAKKSGNFFTKDQPENKLHNQYVPVWKGKCEQIIMKAKFSMKEDKKVLEEIMNYAKELGIK